MDSGSLYLFFYFLIVVLMAIGMIFISSLLGPTLRKKEKLTPYECGMPLLDVARHRFSIKFYLIALLFLLFDVELSLLIPWALVYRRLGGYGTFSALTFIIILILAFIYLWRRGALEWD